jgi:hypothetical protein
MVSIIINNNLVNYLFKLFPRDSHRESNTANAECKHAKKRLDAKSATFGRSGRRPRHLRRVRQRQKTVHSAFCGTPLRYQTGDTKRRGDSEVAEVDFLTQFDWASRLIRSRTPERRPPVKVGTGGLDGTPELLERRNCLPVRLKST